MSRAELWGVGGGGRQNRQAALFRRSRVLALEVEPLSFLPQWALSEPVNYASILQK